MRVPFCPTIADHDMKNSVVASKNFIRFSISPSRFRPCLFKLSILAIESAFSPRLSFLNMEKAGVCVFVVAVAALNRWQPRLVVP